MSELRVCGNKKCNNRESLKRCSRCKSELFCSAVCQKIVWPYHKKDCGPHVPPFQWYVQYSESIFMLFYLLATSRVSPNLAGPAIYSTCVHVCVCACVHACVRVRVGACIFVHVCLCACAHLCILTWTYLNQGATFRRKFNSIMINMVVIRVSHLMNDISRTGSEQRFKWTFVC